MNCAEFKNLRADLLYGELSADKTSACREHLAGCDACRSEFAAIARLQGRLAALPGPETNLDLSRLLTRVLAEQRTARRHWAWSAALAIAAGLLLALWLPANWELTRDHLLVRWQPATKTSAQRLQQGDLNAPRDLVPAVAGYLALRRQLLTDGELTGPSQVSTAPAGPLLFREWLRDLPALERAL